MQVILSYMHGCDFTVSPKQVCLHCVYYTRKHWRQLHTGCLCSVVTCCNTQQTFDFPRQVRALLGP